MVVNHSASPQYFRDNAVLSSEAEAALMGDEDPCRFAGGALQNLGYQFVDYL